MKKLVMRTACALLALLLPVVSLADEAAPVAAVILNGKDAINAALLNDGSDATCYTFKKKSKAVALTIELPEGTTMGALYARLSAAPETVTFRTPNKKGKFDTLAYQVSGFGSEFVLPLPHMLGGRVQAEFAFDTSVRLTVYELGVYGEGEVPAGLHAFQYNVMTDILYIVPTAADVDLERVRAWTADGRTVQVATLMTPSVEQVNPLLDELWTAGSDRYPIFGTMKKLTVDADAKKVSKTWTAAGMQRGLTSLIRAGQAQVIVYDVPGAMGEAVAAALPEAMTHAAEYTYENEDAGRYGLWVTSGVYAAGEEDAALTDWVSLGDAPLREHCAAQFADAQHGDPATIPYPAERLADGYLPKGEFVHEDAENGLWAYASPTVQVQIIRYEQPEIPRVWYVSDVQFKPESETFHQQTYVDAIFPGQMIYPETLAQSARLVFGINGDYYIFRKGKKCEGNIMRAGKVLYDYDSPTAFPNLDSVALRNDGTMSVYGAKETTATLLSAEGDVHDILSFGPYLVRGGKLRAYSGSHWKNREPRNAVGMIEAGHYKVVTVEGRFNEGVGPAGMTLNMLGELLYAEGVNEAINLDGGNTSVLIFMGKKLNRTASKGGNSETQPRNMSELFGVGVSELVHTDMIDAR